MKASQILKEIKAYLRLLPLSSVKIYVKVTAEFLMTISLVRPKNSSYNTRDSRLTMDLDLLETLADNRHGEAMYTSRRN